MSDDKKNLKNNIKKSLSNFSWILFLISESSG
jgi:hypothetical protein